MPPPELRVIHGIRQQPLKPDEGRELKAALTALTLEHPAVARVLPDLLDHIDRKTTSRERWSFTMINRDTLVSALRLIRTKATRPRQAAIVWEEILLALDPATGAILATREQISERTGIHKDEVSRALAELVRWNVLRRFKTGRSALFVLNANIGTHLPAAAGDMARKEHGPLRIVAGRDTDNSDEDQPSLL